MAMSDTLHVRVTDVRYPVTDDVVRSVFGPIAPPRNVHVVPNPPRGTAIAVVQFSDPRSAEACRQQRDNRCIYSDCNRMEISFTQWESFVPSGVLGAPPMVAGPYGVAGRGAFQPDPFANGDRGRGRGRGRGFGAQQHQHQPQVYPQVPPTVPLQQGLPQMQYPQYYSPQQLQQVPYVAPYAMAMPYAPANPLTVSVGVPVRGRGGIHIPAPIGMPMMPPMMMNPAIMAQMQRVQQSVKVNVPNPFLSVAMLDKEVPLQPLYEFCEVYGKVSYVRRNFKKPEILTVKFESAQEAQLASICIKHVPFFGSTISGRNFSSFEERAPEPTAEGDPCDPSILGFNFTDSRHRHPSNRGRFPASEVLRLSGFQTPVTAEAVHGYFESIGLPPVSVLAEEDQRFTLVFADVATGVKALCLGQGKVCGDEECNLTFLKSELKAQQAEKPVEPSDPAADAPVDASVPAQED